MAEVKGLTSDLREEFPQGGTCIHMAPAFRRLGELDGWHRRGHLNTGLLPCAANTMAGDTKSIRPKGFGELCFDLPTKVTDDGRAKEVRVVHLRRSASLDHLHIDLLPAFGFA